MLKLDTSKFSNIELERYVIAGILKYPDSYYELCTIIKAQDFTQKIHQTVWTIFGAILEKYPKVDYRLIALKVEELNINFGLEVGVADYLEATFYIANLPKDMIPSYAADLKKASGRKTIAEAALDVCEKMQECGNDLSYSDIMNLADTTFHDKINVFEQGGTGNEPIDIYEGLEEFIEEGGNDQPQYGVFCPHPLLQKYYGDFYPGDLYFWVSRAKSGKSLWLMNLLHVCCNSLDQKVKGLMVDTELETYRIRWRLMSLLTGINEYYFKTNKWRNNPDMVTSVRANWPAIRNFFGNVQHIYVGNAPIEEVVAIMRRWYKKNIPEGGDVKALICYDYIKLGEDLNNPAYNRMKDYQLVGYKVDKLKKLASELQCPILTAGQSNRSNEAKQSAAGRVDDGKAVGLSDQISQFASNIYLFNRLTIEEQQELKVMFGVDATHRSIPLYTRNQGEEAPGFNDWVKIEMPDGQVKYQENVIYYNVANFRVNEVGDLKQLVKRRENYDLPQAANVDDDLL